MPRPIYLLSPTLFSGTYAMPMITFEIVADYLNIEGYDTLMFTSKQAVKSAECIDPSWKRLPSLAIGQATAKQIKECGGDVLFQPKQFYGKDLSQEIIRRFASRKILYLRPQHISFDSKAYLEKSGIEVDEQIIYKTSCICYSKDEKPIEGSIIVFTSPSTIHCFFKNFAWQKSYTAVVIGKSTLEHLPANIEYAVADQPLIASCIAKAREISLISNSK